MSEISPEKEASFTAEDYHFAMEVAYVTICSVIAGVSLQWSYPRTYPFLLPAYLCLLSYTYYRRDKLLLPNVWSAGHCIVLLWYLLVWGFFVGSLDARCGVFSCVLRLGATD